MESANFLLSLIFYSQFFLPSMVGWKSCPNLLISNADGGEENYSFEDFLRAFLSKVVSCRVITTQITNTI